jgi:hypothetical protein
MLAVQFADFGFGAVVGAFLSGGVAIFLDQRKRKDAQKDRFLEEKKRAYRDFLHFSDLLFHDMMLIAAFMPMLERLEAGRGDPIAVKQAEQLADKLEPNVEKYREHLFTALTDLSLHGPLSTGEPAQRMGQLVKKLIQYSENGEIDKLPSLEAEYKKARDEFGIAARLDLRVNV